MTDTSTLLIETRTERLKQTRTLRAQGFVPGIIYGHRVDPLAVTLPRRDFERAFHKVGRTQLLDLQVGGEGPSRKVLVRQVQYDPRGGAVVHVDFYQVNLKEKITADVPVVVVGESPLVHRREAELLQNLHSLKVNCLPADIPEHIEVDVTGLVELEDTIRVSQLELASTLELVTDMEEVVVKIVAPRLQLEEEPVAEAAEPTEVGAETAEESAPAEG